MKNGLLYFLLCLAALVSSCDGTNTRYHIGVSQCSDDEWRHKMNKEMQREALFYDGVQVEFRTAKDNNQYQINDINYFIDRKVDLLIVAPNEAAVITPSVEKAIKKGIPVVVVDRKILSDNYTAFVGADNYKIGSDVGHYIVSRLNGKGNIFEVTGLQGSTPAMERPAKRWILFYVFTKILICCLHRMTVWLSVLIWLPDSREEKKKCFLWEWMHCPEKIMDWSR